MDLVASYWTLAGDVDVFSGLPSPLDLEERVEAASAAGYRGFGLTYVEVVSLVDSVGYARIRRIFERSGINIIELEGLWDWYAAGELRQRSDVLRAGVIRAAGEFGARHVKVGGGRRADSPDLRQVSDEFGRLCDDLAAVGASVVLEMLPFGPLNSLSRVARVVGDAGRTNGGILLDAWHVARTRTSPADIAALDDGMVGFVELTDGGAAEGDLIEDTTSRRLPCGAGSFDLAGLVDAARATGFVGPYGVEVISQELRRRPVDEVARITYRTARALLDREPDP